MKSPVLYIEDEPDDVFFMRRAFAAASVPHPLQVVEDGQKAMSYLKGGGSEPSPPLPCLVLLDLNLPQVHGLEVLRWIRAQRRLRFLPVIVFSSSQEQRDIVTAYELGANSVLTKPAALEDLHTLVRLLKQYWLERNRVVVIPAQ